MNGQLSLFDINIEEDSRPCRYDFHRYVGQKVHTRSHGVCTITDIPGEYYTHIRSEKGELLVGTPYDISPIKCKNCEHYQMLTSGYMACVASTISPSVNPDDVCDKWEERENE